MAKIYIEVDDDYAFALQWLARAKRTTRPKLLASKIVEELDKLPGFMDSVRANNEFWRNFGKK